MEQGRFSFAVLFSVARYHTTSSFGVDRFFLCWHFPLSVVTVYKDSRASGKRFFFFFFFSFFFFFFFFFFFQTCVAEWAIIINIMTGQHFVNAKTHFLR